jgi:DUF4097 and DUF4098 domain-containing protein YvlB
MKRLVIISLLILALVLVCAGIGSVLFFALDKGLPVNLFESPRLSSEAEESKTLNVDGPITLKVVDEAGKVTITGADVEEVTVNVVKTGFGITQEKADEALRNIQYKIEQNGDMVTLTYKYPERRNQIYEQVDFNVTVPVETTVDIRASFGSVNVTGVDGQVDIDNNFGDIAVEQVDGALTVKTNSGRIDVTSVKAGAADIDLYSGFGSIYLDQVSGAGIQAKSSSGTIDLENVRATGEVELTTEFGNVSFADGSAGSLTISTKSGAVDLESMRVRGALVVEDDFGNINLEKVAARSYDTRTNSGSIIVDGARGAVKANTGFGNITVKNAENVTVSLNTESGAIDFEGSLGEGPHTIHSNFGQIKVSIPVDSELDVDFQTDFGKIVSELPITVILSGELDQTHQAGTINGGGSQFNVSTKSGGITVKVLGQ